MDTTMDLNSAQRKNEGTSPRGRNENQLPRVMRLGIRTHPNAPSFLRGGSRRDDSEFEDDDEADATRAESLTSSPFTNQQRASQVLPEVMRLGLDCAGGGSRDSETQELMEKGCEKEIAHTISQENREPRVMRLDLDTASSNEVGRRQRYSSDEPSTLQLANNRLICLDFIYPKNEPDEEKGGGDEEPPRKRTKYHGVSQTSSLSTTLSEIPYQVFQGGDTDADEESREYRLLLTLSPIDHLDQLLREDQSREESDAVDDYNICNATPYFFQPDRWSCGYRNLQMLLGSLRVLRIREGKHKASTSERSLTGGGMRQTRSLPLDISSRMMALAGVGEGFPQSSSGSDRQDTTNRMDSSRRVSGDSKEHPENNVDLATHSRNVAQSATLRDGYGRTPRIERGLLPSVLETQMLVEQAWQAGYDPEGLEIFRPEGVRGNKRSIGATEAWALLSGLGLRCKIVDFEGLTRPAGEAMISWLEEYFFKSEEKARETPVQSCSDACNVLGFQFTSDSWRKGPNGEEPSRAWGAAWRVSSGGVLPPVFLQHNTHSRTVIGIVRRKSSNLNILMLDPAKHFTARDLDKPDWQRFLFVSEKALLRHDQYQLVHVLPGPVPESEVNSGANRTPHANVYKR